MKLKTNDMKFKNPKFGNHETLWGLMLLNDKNWFHEDVW